MKYFERHTAAGRIIALGTIPAVFLVLALLALAGNACEPIEEHPDSFNENIQTIGQFLEKNKEEFEKSYTLLEKTGVVNTLFAYNPYGDGYTLFLPTDEALEQFIAQDTAYQDLNDLLADTVNVDTIARYHVVKASIRTNDFPYGAFIDSTFTGDRLTVGVGLEDDNPVYKINNNATVIEANLEMTNGFIHVISEVLTRTEVTGYEWLQQQEGYSILAQAMELAEIENRLWMENYTILAEPDTLYHRYGIYSVDDLVEYVPATWNDYTNRWHPFHRFVAFHILQDDYYLNDLDYGGEEYRTLDNNRIRIVVGQQVQISPGTDTFALEIANGDTTLINYVGVDLERSNLQSTTGPIHTMNEILDIRNTPDW